MDENVCGLNQCENKVKKLFKTCWSTYLNIFQSTAHIPNVWWLDSAVLGRLPVRVGGQELKRE